MKSRTRITLTAGAALSLLAVPALAQQGGGQPVTPQITMPKSAGKIQPSHGIQIQMPNTSQGGGAGPAQFNSGSSSGGGASGANAAAGGAASGSGTANAGAGGSAGDGTGTANAGAGGSGNGGAGNGPLNVGQSATSDTATTGSIGNSQNGSAGAKGLAVSQPIQGQQITDLIGMNVLNSKSAQVGTVSDLVMDQKHLAYAVIDVGGGFLGLGDHKIAIPVSKLTLQSNPVVLHTAMTKQQLQKLPAYNAQDYQRYQAGSAGGGGGGNGGNGVGGGQAAAGNQ